MPRTPRTPPYRLHKPSGRAVATFSGRVHYLGKFNSPESRAKYAALLAEWNAAGQQIPPRNTATLTIAQLCVAFLKHAEGYYRQPDGTPTGEAENLRFALRPLNRLYARLPAAEFSPLKLRAVREEMIKLGWVRTNINQKIHRIRGMFKWAESNEILPRGCHVYETLRTVEALGISRDRVEYIIESRGIRETGRAGIARVFDQVAIARIRHEAQQMDGARGGGRAVGAGVETRGGRTR